MAGPRIVRAAVERVERRPAQWGRFLGRRPTWDYRGVWVLDRTATSVVSSPDRAVDPPGFYPSPTRPGSFELWTGVVWAGAFRDPSQPGQQPRSGR